MNANQKTRYEARAKIVKALAHPARLMMVDALKQGPRCVCELRVMVGSDLSTVSKHLSVLKNVGIVRDERRGVQIYYHLRCTCVTDFLECAEKVLATSIKDQAKAL